MAVGTLRGVPTTMIKYNFMFYSWSWFMPCFFASVSLYFGAMFIINNQTNQLNTIIPYIFAFNFHGM